MRRGKGTHAGVGARGDGASHGCLSIMYWLIVGRPHRALAGARGGCMGMETARAILRRRLTWSIPQHSRVGRQGGGRSGTHARTQPAHLVRRLCWLRGTSATPLHPLSTTQASPIGMSRRGLCDSSTSMSFQRVPVTTCSLWRSSATTPPSGACCGHCCRRLHGCWPEISGKWTRDRARGMSNAVRAAGGEWRTRCLVAQRRHRLLGCQTYAHAHVLHSPKNTSITELVYDSAKTGRKGWGKQEERARAAVEACVRACVRVSVRMHVRA